MLAGQRPSSKEASKEAENYHGSDEQDEEEGGPRRTTLVVRATLIAAGRWRS